MREVMYDYQEDMRTEMMGMHLDLVRIGRDWKREMKDMMDVYSKDLKELREIEQRREEDESTGRNRSAHFKRKMVTPNSLGKHRNIYTDNCHMLKNIH